MLVLILSCEKETDFRFWIHDGSPLTLKRGRFYEFSFSAQKPEKTRAQKTKTDLTKLLIGTVLSFFICLVFVICCVRSHETTQAVIVAIFCTALLANYIFSYYLIKKFYRRYTLLCTDDEFKTVLIVSSLRKINSFNTNCISMFFSAKKSMPEIMQN